jgi:hypothetical protein
MVHLLHIDEKMAQLTIGNTYSSAISIDLNDERTVTKQCLLVCEDAASQVESLKNQEAPEIAAKDDLHICSVA